MFNKKRDDESLELEEEHKSFVFHTRFGDDEFERSRQSEKRGYSLRDFMVQMQIEK